MEIKATRVLESERRGAWQAACPVAKTIGSEATQHGSHSHLCVVTFGKSHFASLCLLACYIKSH